MNPPNDVFASDPAVRPSASVCSPAISIAIAGAVVACLVLVGGSGRLPSLEWAAAYLFFAVESDVRSLRIPNWLNFGVLAAVLIASGLGAGALGFGAALAGTGLALVLLFPAYLVGWLGAGDAKAGMVLGAFFGTSALLGILWWSLVIGGVLAIALVTVRGDLPGLLRRGWTALRALSYGIRTPLDSKEGAAKSGIPFALPLALGVLSFDLWGMPWL